jgi:hypothetical protein
MGMNQVRLHFFRYATQHSPMRPELRFDIPFKGGPVPPNRQLDARFAYMKNNSVSGYAKGLSNPRIHCRYVQFNLRVIFS